MQIFNSISKDVPGIDDKYYCLDKDKNIIKCSLGESSIQREEGGFIVKQEQRGDIKISTVFLGLDHSFSFDNSEPLVFETMIFGGEHNDYQTRCSTWDQALLMHEAALLTVKSTNGI